MKTHTLGVLAGAYKGGRRDLKHLLTHLIYVDDAGNHVSSGCRQDPDRLVDEGGMPGEELHARPTCATCARKWDKENRT